MEGTVVCHLHRLVARWAKPADSGWWDAVSLRGELVAAEEWRTTGRTVRKPTSPKAAGGTEEHECR